MGDRRTPEEEAEALREVVREAHAAIKDMTRVLREMRDVRAEIEAAAAKAFGDHMQEQVAAGLAEYRASIDAAIESATTAVYARFDTIADLMLGESAAQRRKGETPLIEHAQRIAEARGDHGGT